MNKRDLYLLVGRYSLLLIFGFFISIFYFIFTPLTVYSSFFILSKVMEEVRLVPEVISFVNPATVIFFKGYFARIIPACVAGSAYYLLLILNLSTPMSYGKRAKTLAFSLILFFLLNVARIAVFAVLVPQGYAYFDLAHELTWYIGSTFMVVVIWFLSVFIFKISEIPLYSDLKILYEEAVYQRRSK